MRTATRIFFAAGFLSGLLIASGRAEAPAAPPLDEIVVTSERTGPGMWHVHRGAANVWILGSISPLPRDMTWRSKQVEFVLESSSQVLVQKPIEISIPRVLWMLIADRKLLMVGGGKKLKDVMPADLHERFAAQRSKVTDEKDKWERYRPLIAAGLPAAGGISSGQPVDAARSRHGAARSRKETRCANRGGQGGGRQ